MTLTLVMLLGVAAGATPAEERELVQEKIAHVLEVAWMLGTHTPVLEDVTELVNELRGHDAATVFAVLGDAHARCLRSGSHLMTVETLAGILAGHPHARPSGMAGIAFQTIDGHVLVASDPPGAGGGGGGIPDFTSRALRDVVGDAPKLRPRTWADGKALLKRYLDEDEFVADRITDHIFQTSLGNALGLSARKDVDLARALFAAKSPYGPNEYVARDGRRVLILALGALGSRDAVVRLTDDLFAALPGAEGKILSWRIRVLGKALRLAGGDGLITRLRARIADSRPVAQRRAFDEGTQGEAVARGLLEDLAKEPAPEDVRALTWAVQAGFAKPRWQTFVAAMDWAAARIEATEGEERDRARVLLHAGHWSFNGNPVRIPGGDGSSFNGSVSTGIGGYPDGLTLHRWFKEDLEAGRIRLSDEQRGLPDLFGRPIVRYPQAWREPKLRVSALRDGAKIRITLHNGRSEALWVNPVAFRHASAWVGLRRKGDEIRHVNLRIKLGHLAHSYLKRYPASVLEKLPAGGDYVFTYPLESRFSQGGIKVSFGDLSEYDGEVPGPVLSSFRETIVRSK